MSRSDSLQVGYVARAHGIAGEIAIRTFDAASDALTRVKRLLLLRKGDARKFRVRTVRPGKEGALVALEGIGSRSEAEALRGSAVHVWREDLPAPAAGEWFQGDLVGLSAVDGAGRPLGEVAEVWNTGPVPNLVIRSATGDELIVPFVDAFVPEVDVPGGRIVVHPPEYAEGG